jgi:hypothetical protein
MDGVRIRQGGCAWQSAVELRLVERGGTPRTLFEVRITRVRSLFDSLSTSRRGSCTGCDRGSLVGWCGKRRGLYRVREKGDCESWVRRLDETDLVPVAQQSPLRTIASVPTGAFQIVTEG